MQIIQSADKHTLGRLAAESASRVIRAAISAKGFAEIIVATGASQFETLKHLVQDRAIDWSVVTMFHLDEYIGLPATHPASFQRYLQERLLAKVPPLKTVHFISGEGDPAVECTRLNALIARTPIDLAFVGIGENGHLAFNDPPADFDTEVPYLVLNLDEACRRQQLVAGTRAPSGDQHVDPPDHEGRAHRGFRPRRAQGARGAGVPARTDQPSSSLEHPAEAPALRNIRGRRLRRTALARVI